MNTKIMSAEKLRAEAEKQADEGLSLLDRLTNPHNAHYIHDKGRMYAEYALVQWFVRAAHFARLSIEQTPENVLMEKDAAMCRVLRELNNLRDTITEAGIAGNTASIKYFHSKEEEGDAEASRMVRNIWQLRNEVGRLIEKMRDEFSEE